MHDYIPGPDDLFDPYARGQFVPFVNANFAALGVTSAENSALQAAAIAWGYSWVAYGNSDTAFTTACTDKDAKRAALEALIRELAQKVQNNPAVTDVQRNGLGITVRKTAHTAVVAPASVPVLNRADASSRCILRLFYADITTPDTKAKPPGVQSCEIREQIGGTAPTDPEAMDFLTLETRAPYRADYEVTDIGKTVYFAMRWRSTRGEAGPWSQIYSAVVPA